MILYTKIENDSFTNKDLELLHFVSKDRQDFILKNISDKNKLLSLYAELLVRYGLQKHYEIIEDISILKHPQGKLFIDGFPNIDFNISHTSNMIMCGINDHGKIGVDVEHKRLVNSNVAKKVYHENEITYIYDNQSINDDLFFEIWTKKEAYTKYLGTGLRYNLTNINMLSDDHINKLSFWQIDNYYFSVYSDEKEDIITEISFDDLSSHFHNL